MTLPPGFASPVRAWRVDQAVYAATWDNGVGAHKVGGRWNLVGVKVVYASLDPATAILEVAVHKGFRVLDTMPHVITAIEIDPASIHVVNRADVPNPGWFATGTPSLGQQQYGAALLASHLFVAIPSVVSHYSWNLIFDPDRTVGQYTPVLQERLSIDTRLNPPGP